MNSATSHAPYVGARHFDAGDTGIFFGRTREQAEVADLWQRHRLTLLHGESGAGKSSLLRAGVLPRLPTEAGQALPLGDISARSGFPLAALPDQNPFTLALLSSWFDGESPTRVSGLSILDCLRK